MTPRANRLSVLLTILLVFLLTVAACGPSTSTSSSNPATTAGASDAIADTPDPGEGPADPDPGDDPEEPSPVDTGPAAAGQTDTSWGRIWDAVPDGFPSYPGATTSDEAADEPASDIRVVMTDPADVATWYQDALEEAAFSTEALSGPFEDGGYVIDSVGDPGCKVQVSVYPLGGFVAIVARYGAACPAP